MTMIMLPCWPSTIFPALRPDPDGRADGRADGVLLTNLSTADIAALDAFEGDTYQRKTMTVMTAAGQIEQIFISMMAPIKMVGSWTSLNGK